MSVEMMNSSAGNILNIAHRGFTRLYPDNTLEAFEAATEIGVDGIELDVQETSDKHFIVFHDSTIKGTSINKLSLDKVRDIRIKGTFKVPTLEEVLVAYGMRTRLLIELKQVHSLERLIVLIKSNSIVDNLIIASFNKNLLIELSNLCPKIRRGIIIGIPIADPIKITKLAGANILIISFPFLNEKLVNQVHALNRDVFVWGLPDRKFINKVISTNIDGIISDFPDHVSEELGQRKNR